MADKTVIAGSVMDWGVASRALPGQTVCGDVHLIKPLPDGLLLAVLDGIGHGAEAAAAATIALGVLSGHAGEPLSVLFRHCHDALIRTRGAVMTVAWLEPDEGRLTWLGVGNVEAMLLRPGRAPQIPVARAVLRSGIVGFHLPALQSSSTSIARGDMLVFATDGVGVGFAETVVAGGPPQQLAERVLKGYFKGTDDALVLVAKYLGTGRE
jgi:negative regulator of sigma-B (phosphoserine phosphatase)